MIKGITGLWLILGIVFVPMIRAEDQPVVRDLSYFLRRLRTVDHLPELEPSPTAMSSTWDRSGGNADGTDFKKVLTVDWPYEAGYWWGEGDWMIWTDENGWPPSYHGTGSEEYFNSGWCQFDGKAVSGFVMLRPGHPTVYSFHLNDAFQFQWNVRVGVEQMGYGPGEKVIRERHPLWTSTAFWYALPGQPAGSD